MDRATIHLIDVTDFRLSDGSGSEQWFTDAFGKLGLGGDADLVIHDGTAGILPSIDECLASGTGTIISGSHGPVWQEKDWIPPLMDLIREIHAKEGWLLGVCFGHQALGHALGGEVGGVGERRERGGGGRRGVLPRAAQRRGGQRGRAGHAHHRRGRGIHPDPRPA